MAHKLVDRKDDVLYVCKGEMTGSDYISIVPYFFALFYKPYVFLSLIYAFFLALLLSIGFDIKYFIIFFLLLLIIMLLYYKFGLSKVVQNRYDRIIARDTTYKEYCIEYYCDRMHVMKKNFDRIILYSNVVRCVEMDSYFCFEINDPHKILVIHKNQCDLELVQFIREKMKNCLDNQLGDKVTFQRPLTEKRKNLIHISMFGLWILSILTVVGSIVTMTVLYEWIGASEPTIFAWVSWIWLIVPLISIVLGKKYLPLGIRCKRNIYTGYVMVVVLFMFGLLSLAPPMDQPYEEINRYVDVLNVQVPDKGYLHLYTYPSTTHFRNFEDIIVKYKRQMGTILQQELEKSDTWFLYHDLSKSLYQLLFKYLELEIEDNSFISIYNATLKEYNQVPRENGEYEMYIMWYDPQIRVLRINHFLMEWV